jgi:hypothetical protein
MHQHAGLASGVWQERWQCGSSHAGHSRQEAQEGSWHSTQGMPR